MHGIHSVTSTHCNTMHSTHNVTLTHCNMMHGAHSVTLKHCNMMHGTHSVKSQWIYDFTMLVLNCRKLKWERGTHEKKHRKSYQQSKSVEQIIRGSTRVAATDTKYEGTALPETAARLKFAMFNFFFTVMQVKIKISWNVTLCQSVKTFCHFEGSWCLRNIGNFFYYQQGVKYQKI